MTTASGELQGMVGCKNMEDVEKVTETAIPRQSLTSAVADKLREQIIRSALSGPSGAQRSALSVVSHTRST
jgi:hypothetical protein